MVGDIYFLGQLKMKRGHFDPRRTSSAKYLGILFDYKLTWKAHLKYALTKAKQRTAFFHQRFYDSQRLSTDTRLLIYETLIRPILIYGAPA